MSVRTESFDLRLPEDLGQILLQSTALEKAYVVGGGVRDAVLGNTIRDFDVEVFGHTYDSLSSALSGLGRVDLVGKSFGVIKLTTRAGCTYDFSLPRRDSKTAPGHKGFVATTDPELGLEEASARRDFTINALMFDPRKKQILDAHGGLRDLEARILRHTSPAFEEDPLRVLRGMQFVARFELIAAPETLALCRKIKPTFAQLAKERVRDEWFKWASRSTKPAAGIRFLADTGWLTHFPELDHLRGTPQDPEWHPEGDVFIHTCHCCDAMAGLAVWSNAEESSRIAWMLAILAHDFGKPSTTRQEVREGLMRTVSPGHEEAGGPLATEFLARINAPKEIVDRVVPLVVNHLAHLQTTTDRAIRRLADRLTPETIEGLCTVMSADAIGRPPRPTEVPERIVELLRRATELRLRTQAPQPILKGRHVLELGMSPGEAIGQITKAAFEAQLEGHFADHAGALRWLSVQADLPLSEEARHRLDGSSHDA